MFSVTFTGRLTKDPKIHSNEKGQFFTMDVAYNYGQRVLYVHCISSNPDVVGRGQELTKGELIQVIGQLEPSDNGSYCRVHYISRVYQKKREDKGV